MVRIIRDITELSPKKQKIAGIVNVFVSIGLILLMDRSMNIPLRTSMFNITVMLIVGVIFMYGYGFIVKRRRLKNKTS